MFSAGLLKSYTELLNSEVLLLTILPTSSLASKLATSIRSGLYSAIKGVIEKSAPMRHREETSI
jgi:hypothetical protein